MMWDGDNDDAKLIVSNAYIDVVYISATVVQVQSTLYRIFQFRKWEYTNCL